MALFRIRDRERKRAQRNAWRDDNDLAVAHGQFMYNHGATKKEAYQEYREKMEDFGRLPVPFERFVGVYLNV